MEEISFPRGGRAPPPSSREDKSVEKKSKDKRSSSSSNSKRKDDFLFGRSDDQHPQHHQKRRKVGSSDRSADASSSMKHSLLPLGGGGVVMSSKHGKHKGQQEPLIEALSFTKLAKGTKLLGVVREVHDDFAVLSLPNLLTGYILRDAKYPLTRCVSNGQYMAVVVKKIVTENVPGSQQKKRRIQVSVAPSDLNSRDTPSRSVTVRGQILSVEDHGCLVDLGHGRKGFLSFEHIEGDYSVLEDEEDEDGDDEETTRGHILQKGRLFDFLIASPGKDSVVPLSLPSAGTMSKHMIVPMSSSTPPLTAIAPGWLVQAKVEALAKNGLCVTFFGNVYRGAVEMGHVGGHFIPESRDGSTAWRDVFTSQQSFTARIVAVDAATKLIRLSILPHLLQKTLPAGLPQVGTVVDNCTVVRMDAGIGALLALPEEYNEQEQDSKLKPKGIYQSQVYQEASRVRAVYVHISKALDEKDSQLFAKQFAPSTSHRVRIVSSQNWIDGIASGACISSIVDAHVLMHSDLQPGHIYRQVPVCGQLENGSILVKLGVDVRGLVPQSHLFETSANSEFRRKVLKEKYAVDSKVDVRVMWVDVAKKRCHLTAKKGLLKASDSDIITSYDKVKIGQKATGFISKIDDREMYITFCNKVYGKVTARSLAAELGIDNHRENYSVGDVVTCRVVKIKKRPMGKNRSRKLEEDDDDNDEEMDDETARTYYDLTLSLNVQGHSMGTQMDDADETKSQKRIRINAGAVLPSKSMKILDLVKGKQKKNGFVPGYAIVSLKSKYLVGEEEASKMPAYAECKLPYDQLMDEYDPSTVESAEALDDLAERLLTVGKKINQRGIILTDPRKSTVEYSSGIGKFTVLSIRSTLVEKAVEQHAGDEEVGGKDEKDAILPSPSTQLYVGAHVLGYVVQVDERHGAFIRFLDNMTGLIPKFGGGLDLPLFSTIVTRVEAIDDSSNPPKLSLKSMSEPPTTLGVAPGDKIAEAKVTKLDFFRATLEAPDQDSWGQNVNLTIHCAHTDSPVAEISRSKKKKGESDNDESISQNILKGHPFYKWKVGKKLSNLTVLSIERERRGFNVHATNRNQQQAVDGSPATGEYSFFKDKAQLTPGTFLTGIVKGFAPNNKGIYVQVSPKVEGFIPALELSTDAKMLNNMSSYVRIGSRLRCCVVDGAQWRDTRLKCPHISKKKGQHRDHVGDVLHLSVLRCNPESQEDQVLGGNSTPRFDHIVGRVNRSIPPLLSPSLMLDLRGGFVGRCCITELEEPDEWANMPLGNISGKKPKKSLKSDPNHSDEDVDMDDHDEDVDDDDNDNDERDLPYPDGEYVICRVLNANPGKSVVDVSLRPSRIEGDLEDDGAPGVGDTVQGYVVKTNKSGCFIRMAREIEGRAIIKELTDGFLPNPEASFPPGRLVVGKVKAVREVHKKSKKSPVKFNFDLDMRESVVLENPDKLSFEDIELNTKHKGTVTRIEEYGIFVRVENSDVSGLVHKSECSDKFIKKLEGLFDPGDLVKVLVIKKNAEEKKIGFSMKASHFEDDEDSDDDSSGEDSMEEDEAQLASDQSGDEGSLNSDDENFASKLADRLNKGDASEDDKMAVDEDDDSDSESEVSSADDSSGSDDSSDDDNDGEKGKSKGEIDMDVGFDWGPGRGNKASKNKNDDDESSSDSESSSDEDDEDDEDDMKTSSHKSRKKQAQRRREEQEISQRETALADGTADENPETAADFERLIAGNPNSSEMWIRYMAFYLSVADIPSARNVANRAFDRIEFRREQEKLNVWTALLTLELRYGDRDSLQKCIDRACQQNNPKHVHMRVCELLEKEVEAATTPSASLTTRADEMFSKMCKKFKSKKKVWIAHMQYLLKQSRQEEAHALLKRALLSLPSYKHAETMSKFAQLEFEFGSAERARTVFHGLLLKYPKRLDMFFVYIDKEIKYGSIETVRAELEKKVAATIGGGEATEGTRKLTDKQMKSLFKKWYRIEEQHGTDETRDHVKDTARSYVEQSSG